MDFKLTKVVFKNIKVKTKTGKEFTASGFYLEHEGLKPIRIIPANNEDYKLLEFASTKKFSDLQPKSRDNSEELLK